MGFIPVVLCLYYTSLTKYGSLCDLLLNRYCNSDPLANRMAVAVLHMCPTTHFMSLLLLRLWASPGDHWLPDGIVYWTTPWSRPSTWPVPSTPQEDDGVPDIPWRPYPSLASESWYCWTAVSTYLGKLSDCSQKQTSPAEWTCSQDRTWEGWESPLAMTSNCNTH